MDSAVMNLIIIALLFALTVRSKPILDPHPHQPLESPSPLSPPPLLPPSYDPSPPPRKLPSPAVLTDGNHRLNKHLSSPPEKGKSNTGKRIGLMFVGVAAALQVCILAFLLISRRLIFKPRTGYQRN